MSTMRRFFLPGFSLRFFIRLLLVSSAAVLLFTQVLIPLRIEGKSMEPTYRDHGFTFCWRGRYILFEINRGDVVAIRLAGQRIMLLKRVVGLPGDRVEFRGGRLLINGIPMSEPYVRSGSDWNLEPRLVEPGKVYVVGDNRSVAMDHHAFGQVERQRIVGGVLW